MQKALKPQSVTTLLHIKNFKHTGRKKTCKHFLNPIADQLKYEPTKQFEEVELYVPICCDKCEVYLRFWIMRSTEWMQLRLARSSPPFGSTPFSFGQTSAPAFGSSNFGSTGSSLFPQAIVKEVFRLHPAIPPSLPPVLAQATELLRYQPKY